METNTKFAVSPLKKAREAYMEHTIRYLHAPSPEFRLLLEEKMKGYAALSGILLHLEQLQKHLIGLERGYESAWESFAKEAESSWFFDSYSELADMFFEAAEKRKLAKKKWVITSL